MCAGVRNEMNRLPPCYVPSRLSPSILLGSGVGRRAREGLDGLITEMAGAATVRLCGCHCLDIHPNS